MSMKQMISAFNVKVGNPYQKLILIKLADNANDHGVCWPSYKHIADQCEMSKRSVITHIGQLKESGFLEVKKRVNKAGSQSNIYQLTIGGEGYAPGVKDMHRGSEGAAPPPSEGAAPRTSNSLEPTTEAQAPRKRGPILMTTYLYQCKEDGKQPLPESSAVFNYQEKTGLPMDFLLLAWKEFKDRSIDNGKRYKSWPTAFLNCVRDNWYGLWWVSDNGEYLLTSKGKQAETLHGVFNG